MIDNPIEKSFKLTRNVPSTYFNASWNLWQAGKPVSVANLTDVLKAMGEKIDEHSVSSMVEIAEFLSLACRV